MKYNKIILLGFRYSGKSYISKLLAEKINWKFIDLDIEVQKEKTSMELTRNGKDWSAYREIETEVLKNLLAKDEKIVIAGGGGTAVAFDFPKDSGNKTYGDIQATILRQNKKLLKVFLLVKEEIIVERMLLDQKKPKQKSLRPTFNLMVELAIKENRFESFVEKTLKVYRDRKPKYQNIADIIMENNNNDDTDLLNKIVEYVEYI